MYNISEAAVHFGLRSFGCGPCSVNMRVLCYETAVLQYAESICHVILTFILDSQTVSSRISRIICPILL